MIKERSGLDILDSIVRIFFALIFLFSPAWPAGVLILLFIGWWEAWVHVNRSKFKDAFAKLQPVANSGDPEAQFQIGNLYARNHYTTRNYTEAFWWYLRAANQGYPAAMEKVSAWYSSGSGTFRSAELAYFWLLLARKSGVSKTYLDPLKAEKRLTPEQAAKVIARIEQWEPRIETGESKETSRSQSIKDKTPELIADVFLYPTLQGGRRSATYPGYGCPCMVSNKEPWTGWDGWMLLGSPMQPGEKRRVGFVFLSGQEGAKIMREAGKFYLWEGGVIGEAQVVRESEPDTRKDGLSKHDDPVSDYKLAKAYAEGDGFKQDNSEALKWYLKAAGQGHTDAQSQVGRMYFMGEGTTRNNEEAYFWYSLAAKSGKPQQWADAVARYLTPEKISTVEKRVSEWTPTK